MLRYKLIYLLAFPFQLLLQCRRLYTRRDVVGADGLDLQHFCGKLGGALVLAQAVVALGDVQQVGNVLVLKLRRAEKVRERLLVAGVQTDGGGSLALDPVHRGERIAPLAEAVLALGVERVELGRLLERVADAKGAAHLVPQTDVVGRLSQHDPSPQEAFEVARVGSSRRARLLEALHDQHLLFLLRLSKFGTVLVCPCKAPLQRRRGPVCLSLSLQIHKNLRICFRETRCLGCLPEVISACCHSKLRLLLELISHEDSSSVPCFVIGAGYVDSWH
mmetsp:Transcript_32407/g.62395  ORF Transcript_32407/g.62395 Transcript_32407/m.62395 type:complete len:276 (-) Transcript_32407:107-934(-)